MKKQYSSPQFTIEELQQEELLLQTSPVRIQNFDNNAGFYYEDDDELYDGDIR